MTPKLASDCAQVGIAKALVRRARVAGVTLVESSIKFAEGSRKLAQFGSMKVGRHQSPICVSPLRVWPACLLYLSVTPLSALCLLDRLACVPPLSGCFLPVPSDEIICLLEIPLIRSSPR